MNIDEQIRKNFTYDAETGKVYRLPKHSLVNITKSRRTRVITGNDKKVLLVCIIGVLMDDTKTYLSKWMMRDGNNENMKWDNIVEWEPKIPEMTMPTKKMNPVVVKDGVEYLACSRCDEEKELNEFNYQKREDSIIGYRRMCRICVSATRRKSDKVSNRSAQKSDEDAILKFNISPKEYDELYIKQDGKCKICNITQKSRKDTRERTNMLVIDHDHTTGQVRGLLCNACNRGIGLIGDTADALVKAVNYLAAEDEYTVFNTNDDKTEKLTAFRKSNPARDTYLFSVESIDAEGNSVKYIHINKAAEITGIKASRIRSALTTVGAVSGGCQWKRIEKIIEER